MSSATAREVTMKLTFARLIGGEGTYDEFLEKSSIDEKPTKHDIKYSDSVIAGIGKYVNKIDNLIARHMKGWTIDRINKVDLCILRIAVYEMLFVESIPTSVSINEAMRLGRMFSGDDSFKFLNGILGSIARRNPDEDPPDDCPPVEIHRQEEEPWEDEFDETSDDMLEDDHDDSADDFPYGKLDDDFDRDEGASEE